MTSSRPPWSKRSLAAQAMGHIDPITKAVVPPIHVSTTYLRDEDNAYSSGYVYGRPDNATVREAEGVIAMLEGAEAGALLFGSGMAAATAVFLASIRATTWWRPKSCIGRCAPGSRPMRPGGASRSISSTWPTSRR